MTFVPIPPDLLAVLWPLSWKVALGGLLAFGLMLAGYWFLSRVSADLDEEERDSE